ncbi:pirin [Burkholderia ubonensis]|uniref:Pirin n=1 Tax=Burkholderia ubonensis TaxID=101571 RepID=A0AB74CY75_9BURK|nr:pirin [Burkholderia ubonensis]PAK00050.1 pirin [Burkholderia ubonensis]RQP70461.1 pirin [Burkholderia ubonensis]RQP87439.1 pirin [Burkholderia ubonensis]
MIADRNEKQSDVNLGPKPSGGEANASHVLSAREETANRNVLADRSDAPGPRFIDEIGPLDVIPLFITRANARELLGRRPGETVAQALARMAKDG